MAATISGNDNSVLSANEAAIGTNATIVPTLVPIHSDTTQADKNNPGSKKLAGSNSSAKFTVASAAPIALADDAKAPANTKIQTISSRSC